MTDKKKGKKECLTLLGIKRGMTQKFDDKGNVTPCTVIEVEPCVVVQLKNKEKDGYTALQLASQKIIVNREETLARRTSKPLLGHFKKANVAPRKHLKESRIADTADYTVGQEIGVAIFNDVEYVDTRARSKGKGYQGVIKRHHYAGGPASHGSGFHRHAGSTGMRSSPGRCLPGGKKAGHMGSEFVTTQNLKVIEVNEKDNVLLVKGAVPGPVGGLVEVTAAVKIA